MVTKEIIDGVEFTLGKSKKFDRDFERMRPLLLKRTLTKSDRLELLSMYQTSYHVDGKIEDFTTCDSSCHGCDFCKKMMEAAKKDKTLICGYCYDKGQEDRWINVMNRHGSGLLIMKKTDYTEDELRIVRVGHYNRINSSGETPDEIYARNCLRIGKVNPQHIFGYWAKNTSPVQQAVEDLGKPSNMSLVQSSIHIGKVDKKREHFDYTFTVYPDKKSVLAAIAAGASPCNGMKCIACGRRCYDKTHESQNVAELLRVGEKKRAEIVARVNAN